MTKVLKQDSNITSLRFAIEDSPGVLPGDPTWYPLEPNSYKKFGGDVKTKARMPINASRQRKKGVVVDLDASADFNQDWTPNNSSLILQFFMYAAYRTKGELTIATVDNATNAYQPASGGDTYYANDLVFGKNFSDTANNGLNVVTGQPGATSVAVTGTGLVAATGNTGTISRVGYSFGSGEVAIDVGGTLPVLKSNVSQVAASSVLTTVDVLTDGETVTVGGTVYTIQDTLTAVKGHVKKGADVAATLVNLKNAINQTGAGTPGTDYDHTNTPANARVTAVSDATTLTVTARVTGAVGNGILTAETAANASWGSNTAHLTNGAGARGFDSFGLIPGEFIFLGGDDASGSGDQFTDANDAGFCRLRSVTAAHLEFDKTQFEMVADNGSGKSVKIFFGRVLKNESDPSLIVEQTVQLERTMGAPDDAQPTQIQAEYILGCLGDTLQVDTKTADIVKLNLMFQGNRNELRAATDGVKTGTRPEITEADAFNSTSDCSFTKMAIVTAGEACPDALFSFFTDLVIDLKNNVKQNKAVGVLGAFSSTLGFFDVQASLTAYFTDVAEIQAVQDNDSVTVETHFAKFNSGISIDLPLVVLSEALADVKINEAIMIPLKSDAATAKILSPDLDHTMLMVFWDYLPTAAQ